jgi:hypothetical protein
MGVLDDMTKGITERKAKAAGPKLTPVGTEASPTKPSMVGIPEVPEVFLTNEAVADVAKDLRIQAALLLKVADGLDALTAMPTAPVADPKKAAAAAKKAAEAEGDAKAAARAAEAEEPFPARMERLKAEAQAAAFAALDAPSALPDLDVAVDAEEGDGWSCPDHGRGNLKQMKSRAGRLYMACQTAGCKKFEKE